MLEYIKKYAKPLLAVLGVIIGVLATIHLVISNIRKNHILNIHDGVEDDDVYDEIEPLMANTSNSMSVEECERMESDLDRYWNSVEEDEDDEIEPVSKNKKAKRKKKSDSDDFWNSAEDEED